MFRTLLLYAAGFIVALLGVVHSRRGFLKNELGVTGDGKFGVALCFFALFIFVHGAGSFSTDSRALERAVILIAVVLFFIALLIGRNLLLTRARQKIFVMIVIGALTIWYTFQDAIEKWSDWLMLFSFSVWVVVEGVIFFYTRKEKASS